MIYEDLSSEACGLGRPVVRSTARVFTALDIICGGKNTNVCGVANLPRDRAGKKMAGLKWGEVDESPFFSRKPEYARAYSGVFENRM